ncbi:HAD family hydrolase [Natronosalvus halobius]|uniref:HAD family hydrolase n=1 Tax=Natronosalvus halobius TaxID=2953746 RepID=UPI0020A1F529|nr:HAD family hydrolase [Natronosalvus halobius]USZ72554.1 HAD family hydrolase [Natronosalvus halobius]
MTVDAVLFDFDDTLYPYAPCNEAGKAAARETALERGYALDTEEFEAFYQTGRRDVKRDLVGTAASHDRLLYFKRALERHTGEPRPSDALALGDAYWEGYLQAMSLHSGVQETLSTVHEAGIDVGIVTNLTTRIQLRKIERLDLADAIDLLVTSEEVGQEKPASVMFTYPLARLECHPSDAVMVGDSIPSDVVGGNAIGLETVLFDAAGEEPDDPDLSGVDDQSGDDRIPDHRIDHFGDLTDLIL